MNASTSVPQIPYNVDAERGVLGSCLLDRQAILPLVAWLSPAHFWVDEHRAIYTAMLDCYNKRIPTDLLTLTTALQESGKLDQIGGVAYLSNLPERVSTPYHVTYYAAAVKKAANLRRLITVGGKIAALGYQQERELEQIYAEATGLLREATKDTGSESDIVHADQLATEALEHLNRGTPLGTPTGWSEYDRITGGLQPGEVAIWAARPGMGKTALLLQAMLNLAKRGQRSLCFSMEMPRAQLMQRLQASATGVPFEAIKNARLTTEELLRCVDFLGNFASYPVSINDKAGLDINNLMRQTVSYQAEYGTPVVFVDYLQLTTDATKRTSLEVLDSVAVGLKQLAKDINTPVVVLCQINREGAKDGGVPDLTELRGSGMIEIVADTVVMPYREDYYNPQSLKPGITELHIAKQRNGPLGVATLYFDKTLQRFTELSPYQSPEGY